MPIIAELSEPTIRASSISRLGRRNLFAGSEMAGGSAHRADDSAVLTGTG